MKKLSIFAIAALAAVGLSSCLKEKIAPIDRVEQGTHTLTLRIAGAEQSRATGTGVTAGTRTAIASADVYVFDGAAITKESFSAADLAAGSRELTVKVTNAATVFVVANATENHITLPTSPANVAAVMGTLGTVFASGGANNLLQTLGVPLATVNNVATPTGAKVFAAQNISVDIAPTAAAYGEAHATIVLAPVVSRIELAQVQDQQDANTDLSDGYTPSGSPNPDAIAYEVTGIFLTEYAPSYTISGTASGTAVNYDAAPANAGDNFGDTGTWASGANAIARVAANQSWNYNVAAGTPARLVVRVQATVDVDETVEGIDLNDDGDADDTDARPVRDVVVQSYNASGGGALTAFIPGVVYKINTIPFDSEIFRSANRTSYTLDVNISVLEWGIENITVNM